MWLVGTSSVPPLAAVIGTSGRNTLRQCGPRCRAPGRWSPSLCHGCVADPGIDSITPVLHSAQSGPRMARTSGSHGARPRRNPNESASKSVMCMS